MLPVVGIVTKNKIIDNQKHQLVSLPNLKYLNEVASTIGILTYDNKINKEVIDLCNAIIFPGGSVIEPYYYDILEYAIKKHIPVLGICLGFQLICLYFNNNKNNILTEVINHNLPDNQTHEVNIINNTFLSFHLPPKLNVNSRHKYQIIKINNPLIISAYSNDNIIEAVEYITKDNFILGLQWHPEDMDNMQTIYDMFLLRAKDNM
ncbi:MAG: gamma-glutamyl-gamma-aminobutyrate hydrolase family protein [bacterium]|nr:gamma-glutamyl-gamma-aminobutyrate hydrolase family protein [bacterium]